MAGRGVRRELFSSGLRRRAGGAAARAALGLFLRHARARDWSQLVRKLLRIRKNRSQLRRGAYFFFNDWDRYLGRGVLLFARYNGPEYTLVAINTGDADQTVPFWFPIGGNYVEELHGGDAQPERDRAASGNTAHRPIPLRPHLDCGRTMNASLYRDDTAKSRTIV